MKKITFVAVLLALVAVTAMAQARPQPAGSPAGPSLDERIKAEIGDFKGKVWIYAKNLDTGKEYGMRADEQVRTASTIKLPIMLEVYRQVAEGKIAWTDPIEITKAVKVGGSGILFEFTDGTKIDVKTAMTLMIVQSDNTATNVILDKVSSNSVNDFMAKLGLNDTLSLRKIGGGGDAKAWDEPVNKLFGIGRSSPRDMVKLLEMLEKGEVVSKEASAEMIAILRRQQYKDGIGRNSLDTVPVASKSGSLDRLRSDVGIVYTRRGRIAMAITVDDMPVVQYIMDDMGNELIWRLSQILQEGLAR
ncbi:MAG TPA: serine hydrolase [Blastocatellia bacterium]|nr:serine hydrolase [Blastocatellia bacterium]